MSVKVSQNTSKTPAVPQLVMDVYKKHQKLAMLAMFCECNPPITDGFPLQSAGKGMLMLFVFAAPYIF